MFDLESFIEQYVTKRAGSIFQADIDSYSKELNSAIRGKSVLVIGGAGSIGSSFIHSILNYYPEELCIVDTNENTLTELTRDLRSRGGFVPEIFLSYPMDYSSVAFKHMFERHQGFNLVANFSAHKHVRSEKDIFSIEALLRNNVLNAKTLLDLLTYFPPEIYFCVSTDKAANPVNIMGASKRIMEDLIFSYSSLFPVKTARFANVAFSNGSLLDGFLKRIALHQPLSAPSDVKRYFVSPIESGQICMLSAILGNNREIFFPKLDEASMEKFDRIAEELLTSMNYEVDYCISDIEAIEKARKWKEGLPYPVYFSESDTSGEKNFEEFYIKGESCDFDRFKSLGVITNKQMPLKSAVEGLICELDEVFENPVVQKQDIVKILGSYLSDFRHKETGKNLDGKM